MKQFVLAIALLTLAVPCRAQGHADIVALEKSKLLAAGIELSGACGAFRITNRVALELRDSGFRLLRKQGGNRAIILSDGSCVDGDHGSGPGYATDYLIAVNEGFVGYDILGDGGGQNAPQWAGPEGGADIISRNVQNVAEPVGQPAPVPIPVPPPVIVPPVPQPLPQPSVDYSSLLQQVIELQRLQLEKADANLAISKNTNEHVVSMDRTLTQTLGSLSVFLGKYVAPALATWYVTKQVTKPDQPAVPAK